VGSLYNTNALILIIADSLSNTLLIDDMIFVYILKHLISRGVGVKTVKAGHKGLSINNFKFTYKVLLSNSVLNKDLIAITNYI
jgi:hypothetical protein